MEARVEARRGVRVEARREARVGARVEARVEAKVEARVEARMEARARPSTRAAAHGRHIYTYAWQGSGLRVGQWAHCTGAAPDRGSRRQRWPLASW